MRSSSGSRVMMDVVAMVMMVVVGSRKISEFRVCVTQQWMISKGIRT